MYWWNMDCQVSFALISTGRRTVANCKLVAAAISSDEYSISRSYSGTVSASDEKTWGVDDDRTRVKYATYSYVMIRWLDSHYAIQNSRLKWECPLWTASLSTIIINRSIPRRITDNCITNSWMTGMIIALGKDLIVNWNTLGRPPDCNHRRWSVLAQGGPERSGTLSW
jgi:hypothetical protein